MANASARDIVIRLENIEQLFNAPDLNPFSEEEVDVLGEPALLRAVRRLLAHRVRNWEGMRLILGAACRPDHTRAGTADTGCAAPLQRCQDRRQSPDDPPVPHPQSARLGHGHSDFDRCSRVLPICCLTAFSPGPPDSVKTLVAASISVFVWVILWDPMEKLLFDWVQPHMENTILRRIPTLDIVIRPKS